MTPKPYPLCLPSHKMFHVSPHIWSFVTLSPIHDITATLLFLFYPPTYNFTHSPHLPRVFPGNLYFPVKNVFFLRFTVDCLSPCRYLLLLSKSLCMLIPQVFLDGACIVMPMAESTSHSLACSPLKRYSLSPLPCCLVPSYSNDWLRLEFKSVRYPSVSMNCSIVAARGHTPPLGYMIVLCAVRKTVVKIIHRDIRTGYCPCEDF